MDEMKEEDEGRRMKGRTERVHSGCYENDAST